MKAGRTRIRWGAAAAVLLSFALVGCDRGEGGEAGGGSSRVSGTLWTLNYPLDFDRGARRADASGTDDAIKMTSNASAFPWPDGLRYLTWAYDSREGVTRVQVFETASNKLIFQSEINGYARRFRPSPVDKDVVMAIWSNEVASTDQSIAILRLRKGHAEAIDGFRTHGAVVDWLPDGTYVAVAPDRTVYAGTVGGSSLKRTGTLAIPSGSRISSIDVSPVGDKMLALVQMLGNTGAVTSSDLWIAGVDGSSSEQFTNTLMTAMPTWSPDGKYVAYEADEGIVCGGGGCAGKCSLWYGSSSARMLDGIEATRDASVFIVKNSSGKQSLLGCDLTGWTP